MNYTQRLVYNCSLILSSGYTETTSTYSEIRQPHLVSASLVYTKAWPLESHLAASIPPPLINKLASTEQAITADLAEHKNTIWTLQVAALEVQIPTGKVYSTKLEDIIS